MDDTRHVNFLLLEVSQIMGGAYVIVAERRWRQVLQTLEKRYEGLAAEPP
jgi:hypothetical protein